MIGLSFKFHCARLIRSMLNKAKFRVEEVQEKKNNKNIKKNKLSLAEDNAFKLNWIQLIDILHFFR